MVKWLRTLSDLSEEPGLIPSTHMVTITCNSSFWGSKALFWPSWALHTPHTDIHAGKTFLFYP